MVRQIDAEVVFPHCRVDGENVLDERREADDVGRTSFKSTELRVRLVDDAPGTVGFGDVTDDRDTVHLLRDTGGAFGIDVRDRYRRSRLGEEQRGLGVQSR